MAVGRATLLPREDGDERSQGIGPLDQRVTRTTFEDHPRVSGGDLDLPTVFQDVGTLRVGDPRFGFNEAAEVTNAVK